MKKFLSFTAAAIFMLILAVFVACAPAGDAEPGDEPDIFITDEESPTDFVEGDDTEAAPRVPRTDWTPGNMSGPGITVATVNGREIGINDVNFRVSEANWMLEMEMDPFDEDVDTDGWDDAVREKAVRLAAVTTLFHQYAEENNITLTDAARAELGYNILDIIADFDDENELLSMLESDGIESFDHFEYIFYIFAVLDAVVESIIDDPALFAEYEEYMEQLLGAKHILISLDEFEDDEDAALELATSIWQRAIAGEDFDALAAEYSADPGLESMPQGYTFTAGQMVPEFEEGTLALEIGEISEPVRSFHGYHIIQRIEPNPEDLAADPWSPAPTESDRMGQAVYRAFDARVDDADIVFLPELSMVQVP